MVFLWFFYVFVSKIFGGFLCLSKIFCGFVSFSMVFDAFKTSCGFLWFSMVFLKRCLVVLYVFLSFLKERHELGQKKEY